MKKKKLSFCLFGNEQSRVTKRIYDYPVIGSYKLKRSGGKKNRGGASNEQLDRGGGVENTKIANELGHRQG